jgi:hypothetical protein
MIDKEKARRAVEEQRGMIRAVAGNILAATDAGTAIRVLTEELEELKNSTGEPASDTFMEAVCNRGALCQILCEFCKRTHFMGELSHGDYEEGELEDLRVKARKKPDKYIEHNDYDSISWGYINGKQIVWGCPCNSARQYEQWIWSHRYVISKYLRLRAQELETEAKFAKEVAEEASHFDELHHG